MKELLGILESRRVNCSRGMQRAIRQIDTSVLARILNDLDEKYHQYFYRNMTEKSVEILKKEMSIQKELMKSAYNGEYDTLERDIATLCSILKTYTNENFDEVFEYPVFLKPIDLKSPQRTVKTFYELATFAKENGLMALDGLQEKSGDPLFKKALELLLLGIEPFRFQELLENYRDQYAERMERIYTMIIKGIRSIYDGDHPEMVQEKLKSIREDWS
jgi:hypothetical protein